jgi:signal transduction histidine kinase
MLEGLDNSWRKAGEEKAAYYYNVPPGHYTFRVKAANSDGIWAEKSIGVIVAPPWWRTWWAYTLYGLLFLGGVFAVHNYQRKRLIQKEREKTRARELAQAKEIEKAYAELKATQAYLIQREKLASLGELTAGIAHEIQNPLNFVNNFSEVNLELIEELTRGASEKEVRALAANLRDNEQKIHQHGKRAASIVKSMMEHSRSSTGQKELTDLNVLVDEYLRLAYHGMLAKDKAFNAHVQTQFDPYLGKVNINAQDIGRVLLNLLNNAFYSVNEKKGELNEAYEPVVTVRTQKLDGKIEISVRDNGVGIPAKIVDKIFQPFFTTKPTGQGTGLGLSLSYEIITEEHGGELSVETKEGEYAVFFIRLPAP